MALPYMYIVFMSPYNIAEYYHVSSDSDEQATSYDIQTDYYREYITKVTEFTDRFTVEFKSGITIEIEG